MVFLMVPVSTCNHTVKTEGLQKHAQSNFTAKANNCSKEASQDMQETIQKIANESGIPESHIVNAWQMLRDPNREVPGIDKDDVHPNLKGNGEIAQEFFMKMSLSPDYLLRQGQILAGQDAIYNKAIELEYHR